MNRQEQDRRMVAIEEMERELAQPLGCYREAVTALAEREMARTARIVMPAEQTTGWRPVWAYAWAPAGLLLLLLVVGLAKSNHAVVQSAATNEPVVARVEAAPTPQHVSDDALMTEIDEDLNQNAPTPLAPLEVSTTSKTHTNTTQVEDTYGVEP
jgi:hypothetical protein